MIGVLAEKLREQGGLPGAWKNPLIRNILLLYVIQFSTYLFPLATLPFLARVLQPEKTGLVFYAQSFIWYFVILTDYGFGLTGPRKVAIHRDDPPALERTFAGIMAAKLLLLLGGFVFMELAVLATPKLRSDPWLYTLSYLSVAGNVLFPVWFFQGLQRMEQVAIRDFASKFLGMLLLFWLVRGPQDYLWAAAIQSGATLVGGLIGISQIRKLVAVRWWVPWSDIRAELKESWPMFTSMVALTAAGSTNVFLLGLFSNDAEVGFFGSAYRVIVALRTMVSPIANVLYPHLSRMAQSERERAVSFLNRTGILVSVPFGLGSLVLLVGAPWIVPLVFGARYLPVIGLMQVMAASPFLLAISHNYGTFYMMAHGYDREWSRIVMVGTVLNFAIFLPLLWVVRGSYAAAITTLVMDVYSAGSAYAFFRWKESSREIAPGGAA